jgi:hypothetical protein
MKILDDCSIKELLKSWREFLQISEAEFGDGISPEKVTITIRYDNISEDIAP